jgi:hypothetical protein
VAVGAQVFPPAEAIAPLIGVLVLTSRRLFEACRTESDELLVAAWAAWGVTAIHPFDNANGRTAIDWANHLLMRRWRCAPLPFPEDAHAALGPAFAALDAKNPGQSAADFVAATEALVQRLGDTTLSALKRTPNLSVIADFLAGAAGRDFRAWA